MAVFPDPSTDPAAMAMRVASAVLGGPRADGLCDRITERAEHARRVEQAAASPTGQRPSHRAQPGPTMASAEAARRCRERIEILDTGLHALA